MHPQVPFWAMECPQGLDPPPLHLPSASHIFTAAPAPPQYLRDACARLVAPASLGCTGSHIGQTLL